MLSRDPKTPGRGRSQWRGTSKKWLPQLDISDPGRVLSYVGHSVDGCPGNSVDGEVEAGGGAGGVKRKDWRSPEGMCRG